MKNQSNLEKKLKVKFNDPSFLKRALTHRSYLNESRQQALVSNERLEFLGDAILDFVVSEWLFNEFPKRPEGILTNLRTNLVKTETLAQAAQKFKLGEYLFLSRGEKESGGQTNPSLMANTFEAVICAIFLDQGLAAAQKFIKQNLQPFLTGLIKKGQFKDAKSLLQEKIQIRADNPPLYRVLKQEGPDHNRVFTVAVFDQNQLLAKAKGKSKQKAEEAAAKLALEKIAIKR